MLENVYRVIEDTYICGNSSVVLYGISVFSETTKDMRAIHCLSENFKEVNDLCYRCNFLRLDPVHLDYAIEDFLLHRKSACGYNE